MEEHILGADPRRQAVHALRGYVYQIWHTLHAWLELTDEERLFVEGAEDFDIVTTDETTAVQVKSTAGAITLRSPAVVKAIVNFWKLRKANPCLKICFRFLTCSRIGVEREQAFGPELGGLRVWQTCDGTPDNVDKIRRFLLHSNDWPEDLKSFLESVEPAVLWRELIAPIAWETGCQEARYVEQAIERKLVLHGDRYRVPPSKAKPVVYNLLREVLETACRRVEPRILDRAKFLAVFEEATTERMPTHRYQALMGMADQFLPDIPGSQATIPLQLLSRVQPALPQTPFQLIRRDSLVDALVERLGGFGILVLTGSTGMGKTTIAKLVAIACKDQWYWVNFSSLNSGRTTELLGQFASQLEQKQGPISVVFDDLDLSPASFHFYEDYLGGLLYTISERKGKVIVTSQQPLPLSSALALGLRPETAYEVPPLNEDEIVEFAGIMGCTDLGLAKKWSKAILFQTSGHPQLTHAYLCHLSERNWPEITAVDFISTPVPLERIRAEKRAMLVQQLMTDEHRELLYRLSLVAGSFRKAHALTIAGIKPVLNHPGDLFDRLLGPWIETLGPDRYCVSPLLNGAATQVWPSDKIQHLHAALAVSILRCDPVTATDATAALFHAWSGRSPGPLVSIAHALLAAPEEIQRAVARELWALFSLIFPHENVFPLRAPLVASVLRQLQFRVAAEVEPDAAPAVAEAWREEIGQHEPRETHDTLRFALALEVIVRYRVKMSPKFLLSRLEEIVQLAEQNQDLAKVLLAAVRKTPPPGVDADPIMAMFALIIPRCTDVCDLEELMDSIHGTPESVRVRLVKAFETDDANAIFLLDQVWLGESKKEQPDWPRCLRAFEKVRLSGLEFGTPSLAAAAVRGSAIILNEYLNDGNAALLALDDALQTLEASPMLEDYRATILFGQGKFDEALQIWKAVLPVWSPVSEYATITPMFSHRKAGICAAKLGQWSEGADFFNLGHRMALSLNKVSLASGFLTDAGFCLWNAGKFAEMVVLLTHALECLEKMSDAGKDAALTSVMKRVSYTVLWIHHSAADMPLDGLTTPQTGMCSDPEPLTGGHDTAPIALIWVSLAFIEHYHGAGSAVFERMLLDLADSPLPPVKASIAELKMRRALRLMKLDSLVTDCQALVLALSESQSSERRAIALYCGIDALFSACVVLLSLDKLDRAVLESWRELQPPLSDQDEAGASLQRWVLLAGQLLSSERHKAVSVMADTAQSREHRLLAALRLGAEPGISPDELFYAHSLLLDQVSASQWRRETAERLAALFAEQWKERIAFRAALRAPQITVPEITKACDGEEIGMQKAARILLSVSQAVDMKLPLDLEKKFHRIARGN